MSADVQERTRGVDGLDTFERKPYDGLARALCWGNHEAMTKMSALLDSVRALEAEVASLRNVRGAVEVTDEMIERACYGFKCATGDWPDASAIRAALRAALEVTDDR